MNRTYFFVLPLLVALAAGCDNNPGKDKPQATVSSATPTTASTAASAGTLTYNLSQDNSKVEFTGAKITGKHNGSFGKFTGTIALDGDKPETGKVTIDIEMSSLTADQDKLIGHLKSGDFFDVEKFPKATFVSSSVKATSGGAAPYSITGNLTMKGVTKSISFPATIRVSGDAIDASAEFAINRKDWGIVYPGKPDDLIKDEVLLKLTLHSARTKS
jgi:polyisoprenoid-binding protein YceI